MPRRRLMRHDPPIADPLDAVLDGCNPVEKASISTRLINLALDEIGAAITDRSPESNPVSRQRPHRRGRVVVLTAAVVAVTATAAAAVGLSAHTGEFQPTRQEIASAEPQDAARMQSDLEMGGPGEFLDPAAPDFRDVALQLASDIPYPDGYATWRDFLISQEVRYADGGTESSGALHGWFAGSAFCAWVLEWRDATIAGDDAAAADAARVISDAPGWKAVTDEDPNPDPSVPGDLGSTQYTLFGWMLPYRDAVVAGDRAGVDRLLATGYGDKCWTSDPNWMTQMAAHPLWGQFTQEQMAAHYERYLAGRSS
jgi:hypothetical protein